MQLPTKIQLVLWSLIKKSKTNRAANTKSNTQQPNNANPKNIPLSQLVLCPLQKL